MDTDHTTCKYKCMNNYNTQIVITKHVYGNNYTTCTWKHGYMDTIIIRG